MLLSIHRFSSTPLPTLLPFNKVGVSINMPLVRFYVPSRLYAGNYYDTTVRTISVPIATMHNATGDRLVIKDTIEVSKDSTIVSTAPTATLLLLLTNSTTIEIYRAVANAWVLVTTVTTTLSSMVEERVLPICLTSPATIAYELVKDCRASNAIQDGQIVRTGQYTYVIPLVGFSGTQVATIDMSSISLLDMDTIDRVFITNSMDMDMFPYSAQGKHIAIQVYNLGTPHATVFFGANFTQASAAIPLTNISSPSGSLSVEGALTGPLVHTLSVPGGVKESSQYDKETIQCNVSRSLGTLDIDFTVNATVQDGHPYLVVCVHEDTVATHAEYPQLPAHPEAINLVLDFANKKMRITMADDTAINTCPGGCSYANTTLTGSWRLSILPTDTGSIVTVYHGGNYVDSVVLSVLSTYTIHKPLFITTYLNSHEAASASIMFSQVNNPVPVITEKNMCSTVNLTGVLTPCMDDATLIPSLNVKDHIDFESLSVGPLAQLTPIPSLSGGFTWTISNNASPCQISDNALLNNSTQELYLTANSFLLGTAPTNTNMVSAFSARWYIRFNNISAGRIFEVRQTPTSTSSPIRYVTINLKTSGWEVRTYQTIQSSNSTNWIVHANSAPAPVANSLYCVGLTITATSIILYINGVAYPCAINFSPSSLPRLFASGSVPETQFKITLLSPVNCFIDSFVSTFAEAWTSGEMFALNNDPLTRASTVDCDYTQLTTDLSKLPITSPVTVSGYGGSVVSTQARSMVVNSVNIVQVYSLPDNYGAGLLDIHITPLTPTEVTVLYGNNANAVYEKLDVSEPAVVRAMRISRGMGVFIKAGSQVTVRIAALLM